MIPCIADEMSLTHVQMTVGIWGTIVKYEDGSAVMLPLSSEIDRQIRCK